MTSRRTAKISHAILETVSSTILLHLKDPRVQNVTVLNVEVAGDVRSAKVYVSVMGDAKTQALTMRGLNAARGFLQSKVAERLQTRNTPILTFILDQGVKKSIAASVLIREAMVESEAAAHEGESHEGESSEGESLEFSDEPAHEEEHPDPGDSGP
jgi:ribosome-binding factor A